MSRRSADLLLEDIWEAIGRVEQYTLGMTQDVFEKDEKSRDAVARNLEVIGEATNRLPEEVKTENPSVEWHKIVGLRHRIVHDYFDIDIKIIWQILQHELPEFKAKLKELRDRLQK